MNDIGFKEEIIPELLLDIRREKGKRPLLNIILFIVTIFTTLFAGAFLEGVNPFKDLILLYKGIPFSFTLLFILGTHELGHYFASKIYKMRVTLPYFIPAPTIIGTFGAIIKMKSPIPNRKALLDIGAAGPIAGFIVSVPAVIIGLRLSEVKYSGVFEGFSLGSSVLFSLLVKITIGTPPQGFNVFLHPIAFAGWLGLLVTALNLLPLGQLDGGHIAYALFGKRYKVITKIAFISLLPLGYFWPGWFFWALIIFFLGFKHPPPIDNITPLDRKRKIIGFLCIVMLFLTFVPVPISYPVP